MTQGKLFDVSVIVPCKNAEKTLRRALNALVGQKFMGEYHLYLVNDKSTDKTLEILYDFKSRFTDLITISDSFVDNLPGTRNSVLYRAEASSDYVMFCDADDVPHKNFISYLYHIAVDNHAEVGVANYRLFHGKVKIPNSSFPKNGLSVSGTDAAKLIIQDSEVRSYVWNKIFSSELLEREGIKFIPENFCYEDLVFSFQAFLIADRVFFGNKVVYDYRVRKDSLSHTPNPRTYLDHVNAYASCRYFMEYATGKENARKFFGRMKKRMMTKTFYDILYAASRTKCNAVEMLRNRKKYIDIIAAEEMKIKDMPWKKYIEEMMTFIGRTYL